MSQEELPAERTSLVPSEKLPSAQAVTEKAPSQVLDEEVLMEATPEEILTEKTFSESKLSEKLPSERRLSEKRLSEKKVAERLPSEKKITNKPPSEKFKLPTSSSNPLLNFLLKVREPVAEYQAVRGLPRTEKYSFIHLLTALCQHTYNAGVTIFTMLYNLLPLLEGFTYFLRFVLDKSIDIMQATDLQDKILKSALFASELLIISIMLFFIITIILIPIVELTSHFTCRLFGVAFNH